MNHLNKWTEILSGIPYFEELTKSEVREFQFVNNVQLATVVEDYLEEIFVDPDSIILRPKPVIWRNIFLMG